MRPLQGALPCLSKMPRQYQRSRDGSRRFALRPVDRCKFSHLGLAKVRAPAPREVIMDYDVKIDGGLILDGSGRAAVRGAVAIKNGRMVAVGGAPGTARRTIDAAGLIVAPGFVDIHTHYDAQVMWDRMLTVSPWHGVTTVVMGNCGFGVAPTRPEHRGQIMRTLEKVEGMSLAALEAGLGYEWPFQTFPQYLDAIERRGVGINVAALIGHTAIRM